MLKTDYKDAVWSGDRRVRVVPDAGTAYTGSIEDITNYDSAGDIFSAADINATNTQVNQNAQDIANVGSLTSSAAFTYEKNFAAYGTSNKTQPFAVKSGRIVTLFGSFKNTSKISSTKSNGVLMGHLPVGFEPLRPVAAIQQSSNQNKFMLMIEEDGGIWIARHNTSDTSVPSGSSLRIGCTYISAT